MKTQTGYKYIVKVQGICGGSPIINGTRIAVRTIIEYIGQFICGNPSFTFLPSPF